MKYLVMTDTIVWKTSDGVTKRDMLKAGKIIYSPWGRNGYRYIELPTTGFVIEKDLRLYADEPLPPPVVAPSETLRLYRVLHGPERPSGMLDPNVGSFDIAPMYVAPSQTKGNPVKITLQQWNWIAAHNFPSPGWTLQAKMNWLLSTEGGNDMFMSYDDASGEYRIPSPGVSGGAIVNIRSIVSGFGEIDFWPNDTPLDNYLPPWLQYVWYQVAGGSVSKVRGGILTPIIGTAGIKYYIPMTWLEKV